MKRTAALRVTGEICFYFSILTLFPVFRRWTLPMAGFALSCLVVALVAVMSSAYTTYARPWRSSSSSLSHTSLYLAGRLFSAR